MFNYIIEFFFIKLLASHFFMREYFLKRIKKLTSINRKAKEFIGLFKTTNQGFIRNSSPEGPKSLITNE